MLLVIATFRLISIRGYRAGEETQPDFHSNWCIEHEIECRIRGDSAQPVNRSGGRLVALLI